MSHLTVSKILEDPFSALSLSEMLKILAALGWSTNYLAMAHRTHADNLPAIAVLPLCCDIAWEFTYAWIYPQASGHWQGVVRVWFFLHTAVLAATLRYAQNDWAGTPLGKSRARLVLLYVAVIGAFAAGQLCLALEMGGALGFHWGGALCQFLSSSGAVGQLLTRGHTRGASLVIWGARAISTAGGFVKLCIRFQHQVDGAPWLDSPMCWFYIGIVLSLDASYPVLYQLTRRHEEASGRGNSGKVKSR